ncbi:MAG: hypothetical protein HY751_04275 [Nitrospinae bacterium]|nr:hypothetical protein [Nitrospinota bacterium]
MSDQTKDTSETVNPGFVKTAAAIAVGAAAGAACSSSDSSTTASGGGTLPDSTAISDLMDTASASLLTATAAQLTKSDLLNLRESDRYKTASLLGGSAIYQSLSVADLESIESAFDNYYGTNGASGSRMARTGGYDPSVMDTVACCCCSTAPCCCCTAAAQADPVNEQQ